MSRILENLNQTQLKAVTNTDGPLLILAGAGSGKTKVVTSKIAYLIEELKVNPQEILAFTFTNKAANEMKERVMSLIDFNVDRMWIGTFHSICVKILRRDLNIGKYTKSFSIFDTSDQKTLIKECLKELDLDPKIFSPNYIQGRISGIKNEGVSIEEFKKFAISPIDKKVLSIYELYQEKLENNNAFDFDDLIIKTIELLENDTLIRRYYQERFRYVFVDEYQDTNNTQYKLIKLLSSKHNNVTAVGDADQSIYKWRGANINNILNFEKDFKNSSRIILSQNYRSTKNILESANTVITNNIERIKKDLWTDNTSGNKPKLYTSQGNIEEAIFVVEQNKDLLNKEVSPKEIAILYRSNSLSRSFEEQLIKNNITYKVIGGIKFYDRAEIKDLLAYLRLIVNQNDDVSLRRIINSPKRGIGDVTVEKLSLISREKELSLLDSLNYLNEFEHLFDKRSMTKLSSFKNLIDNLIVKSNNITIYDLLEFLIDRVEYKKILELENTIEAKSKLDNIDEFQNSIKQYEENEEGNLSDFISGISLLSDVDKTEEKDEAVSLLTIHSAKGLEFEYVFIVALEEGIFPSSYVESDEDLQEERRLMYVAITRAKKDLFLTTSKTRTKFGKSERQIPSIFIKELENSIERLKNESKQMFIPRESSRLNIHKKFDKKSYMPSEKPTIRENISVFKDGQTIEHKKWGRGLITQIKPDNEDQLITVLFDSGQIKTFIGSITPMEVIND